MKGNNQMGHRKVTKEQQAAVLDAIYRMKNRGDARTNIVRDAFANVFHPKEIPIKLTSSTTWRYWSQAMKLFHKPKFVPAKQSTLSKFTIATMRKLKYCPCCGTNLDVIQAALEMIEAQR